MSVVLDPSVEEHLEALHSAIDYIPKRALRYFLQRGEEERIAALIQEMQHVVQHPDVYVEEQSQLLFYGILILASLSREEGIDLVEKIGALSLEQIDLFLGEHLFDSFALALSELYKYRISQLKALIENPILHPALRAAAVQALILLFGQGTVLRGDAVSFMKKLLDNREEKLPYLYDLIASASFALHPEGMIDSLRSTFEEGYIDTDQIELASIEEILALPKEQVIAESRETMRADLKDLIAHLELARKGSEVYERNDTCPCGSGQKYKKCCH